MYPNVKDSLLSMYQRFQALSQLQGNNRRQLSKLCKQVHAFSHLCGLGIASSVQIIHESLYVWLFSKESPKWSFHSALFCNKRS